MRRIGVLTFACGLFVGIAMNAAVALAQAPAAASAVPEPLTALFGFIGSSATSGLLYLWLRTEQKERREAVDGMLKLVQADVEHKTTIRERLKSQDDLLAKLIEIVSRIEARVK